MIDDTEKNLTDIEQPDNISTDNQAGHNVVNTDESIVSAEFDQIAKDLGIEPNQSPSDESIELTAEPEVPIDAQVAMGKQMIGGALNMGFNDMIKINVPSENCFDFAENLSVVICKYYPGGWLAFMEKYKEEGMLCFSTFTLVSAVMVGLKEKRAANTKKEENKSFFKKAA